MGGGETTNYEKIKAMTATELAKFLEARTECVLCNIEECSGNLHLCTDAHLKWLESEVEDNA